MRSRGVNQENVGRTGEETTRENANMPELETASNLHSETYNTEEGDEAQKEQTTSEVKLDESAVIARLKDGEQYKFLGVQENLKQEDNLVLNCAAEVYLKRVSVIWSSPLSDHNRITATNQFALPVLAYLMRTQK